MKFNFSIGEMTYRDSKAKDGFFEKVGDFLIKRKTIGKGFLDREWNKEESSNVPENRNLTEEDILETIREMLEEVPTEVAHAKDVNISLEYDSDEYVKVYEMAKDFTDSLKLGEKLDCVLKARLGALFNESGYYCKTYPSYSKEESGE